MDKETYILNEIGIDKAREKIAIKYRQLLDNKEKSRKEKEKELMQIMLDKEMIENGNNEVIKKYIGD